MRLIYYPAQYRDADGLIFYRCGFSFFFSTPNLWGHWTDLNQTWIHIHLWWLFKKFGPNSIGHLPPRAEDERRFWDRLWTLTEHISATEQDIKFKKKLSICMDSPICFPYLVNFGQETAENSWPVFANPLNFRIGRHCQLYRMHVIQQTAGKLCVLLLLVVVVV